MHGIHGMNNNPGTKTMNHGRIVLKDQIQLLAPSLVIGFGQVAYTSLNKIMPFGTPRSSFNDTVMDREMRLRGPWRWMNNSYIEILPHAGGMGTANIGGAAIRNELWHQLGLWIQDNILLR